jgi:hypothetical protein
MKLVSKLVTALREAELLPTPAQQRAHAFLPLFMDMDASEGCLMFWWKDGDQFSLRSAIQDGAELPIFQRAYRNEVSPNWFGQLPTVIRCQRVALELSVESLSGELVAVFTLTNPSANGSVPEDWDDCSYLLRSWLEKRRAVKQVTAFQSFVTAVNTGDPRKILQDVGKALEQFCGHGSKCEFLPLHPLARAFCDNKPVEINISNGVTRAKKGNIYLTCVPIPMSIGGENAFVGFRLTSPIKDFTLTDEGICNAAKSLLSEALPNAILRHRLSDLFSNKSQLIRRIGPKLMIERDEEHSRYRTLIEDFFDRNVTVEVRMKDNHAFEENSWNWEDSQVTVQVADNIEFLIQFNGGARSIPEFEKYALIALISEMRLAILFRQNSETRINEIREVRHAFRGGLTSATGNLSALVELFNLSRNQYAKNPEIRQTIANDFFYATEIKAQIENCEHALFEIDSFLGSSRILMSEMTTDSLQKTTVNLIKIISDVRKTYTHLADQRGLKIRTFKNLERLNVVADVLLLKLCLSNILDNAIKYSWRHREKI